jgi:hypothetical protein
LVFGCRMLDAGLWIWEVMWSETAILGRSGGFYGEFAGEPRLRRACMHGLHRCARGCGVLTNALNACDERIGGWLSESHALMGRESAGFGGWRLSGMGVWRHRAFRLLASGTTVFCHRASMGEGIGHRAFWHRASNGLTFPTETAHPAGLLFMGIGRRQARDGTASDSCRGVYDFFVKTI